MNRFAVRDLRAKIQRNLRAARVAQGYTRGELEGKAGIPSGSMKSLEAGKSLDVHLGLLIRACWALGLVLSDLTGELRSGITTREYQLLKMYRGCNVTMRRRLLYVAMAMVGELDDEEEKVRVSTRNHGAALGRSLKDLDEEIALDSVFGTTPPDEPEAEEDERCQDFPMDLEQDEAALTAITGS